MVTVPLSREEVLNGALRLLDEAGLDALTMRRLAQSLGVRAGAIYWHFGDKQELEDAMVEEMFAGLLEPPLRGRWDAQLAELCRRMAAAMLRRRDGARLSMRALRPGPQALALSEAFLAIVRQAGRRQRETLWAASVIGYYVIGYVTDVQATEAAKARGLVAVARRVTRKLDRKRYPEIARVSARAIEELESGREMQARFDFGLDVILKGLKSAPPRARRRPRRRG